jgi:hypothetical protein
MMGKVGMMGKIGEQGAKEQRDRGAEEIAQCLLPDT